MNFLADVRESGFKRALKTSGRRLFGFDRRYVAEIMRQLDLTERPGQIRCMNAAAMTFRGCEV